MNKLVETYERPKYKQLYLEEKAKKLRRDDKIEALEQELSQLRDEIKRLKTPWLYQDISCKDSLKSDRGIACKINNGFCMHADNQIKCSSYSEEE